MQASQSRQSFPTSQSYPREKAGHMATDWREGRGGEEAGVGGVGGGMMA